MVECINLWRQNRFINLKYFNLYIMLLLGIVVIVGLIFLLRLAYELAIKVIVCIVAGIMGVGLILTVANSILGTNNIAKKNDKKITKIEDKIIEQGTKAILKNAEKEAKRETGESNYVENNEHSENIREDENSYFEDNIKVLSVEATSELEDSTIYNYSPYNILDNNKSTSWVEGREDSGIGEKITLRLDKKSLISGFNIINGYAKDDNLYFANNRVKTIKVEFPNGSNEVFKLEDNNLSMQRINFSTPVKCSEIRFEILDVYKGEKYNDTAIAELNLV